MEKTNQTNGKRRLSKAQMERRRRRRRRAIIIRAISLGALLLVLVGAVWGVASGIRKIGDKKSEEKAAQEEQIRREEEALAHRKNVLAQAAEMALGYDYDGAIDLIKSVEGYEQDADLIAAAAE